MKVDRATTAATVKATVVKKPKTFCARTSVECILAIKKPNGDVEGGWDEMKGELAQGWYFTRFHTQSTGKPAACG